MTAVNVEYHQVTIDDFPYAQADAIRRTNGEKEKSVCVALNVTDAPDIHCFVAVNSDELRMPAITGSDKSIIWHYTRVPHKLIFENTHFMLNLVIASGTTAVELINCRFAEDKYLVIHSGVKEIDIVGNHSPVRIRVTGNQATK